MPFSVQFSVFLANRVGQLKELLDVLAENQLSVLGVSIVDSTDWAVIRLVLSDPDKAREILASRRLPFTDSRILLAELTEQATLAGICDLLLRAEINVHFAFTLTLQRDGHPVLAMHVDDLVAATHALGRHGIVLLGSEDLNDPR